MEKVGDSLRMSNRLGEERTREEKAETRAVVSRGQDSRMCGKEEPLGKLSTSNRCRRNKRRTEWREDEKKRIRMGSGEEGGG